MKLSTKLTYEQAIGIKKAGWEVVGLEDTIKEYEELQTSLISLMNTISLQGGWICLNSFEEFRLDNLKKLESHYTKLFNTPNINNYFFEEKGTTELSILFEDLISSSSRVKFLIEHHDTELYDKFKDSYLKFISDTAYKFKDKLIADFELVENTNY